MTVSTTREDQKGAAPGLYSARASILQNSECAMSFLNTAWTYCPFLNVMFWCRSLKALISVLNLACCAAFEELLCVWRWRWCWWSWGGAVLVAEGHGGEGGYFNFQTGQSSPLLTTHTWLSRLQVFSTLCFLFLFLNIMKERILLFRVAAHFHWPPVAWGIQPMISLKK